MFHLFIRVKGHQGPLKKRPHHPLLVRGCRAGRHHLLPSERIRRKVSRSGWKHPPVQLWSWHQFVPTCSSSMTSFLPAIVPPPTGVQRLLPVLPTRAVRSKCLSADITTEEENRTCERDRRARTCTCPAQRLSPTLYSAASFQQPVGLREESRTWNRSRHGSGRLSPLTSASLNAPIIPPEDLRATPPILGQNPVI